MQQLFETTSKKLEEFLYVHLILWAKSYINDDGETVWIYLRNEEFDRVLEEFRAIQKKRRMRNN